MSIGLQSTDNKISILIGKVVDKDDEKTKFVLLYMKILKRRLKLRKMKVETKHAWCKDLKRQDKK